MLLTLIRDSTLSCIVQSIEQLVTSSTRHRSSVTWPPASPLAIQKLEQFYHQKLSLLLRGNTMRMRTSMQSFAVTGLQSLLKEVWHTRLVSIRSSRGPAQHNKAHSGDGD